MENWKLTIAAYNPAHLVSMLTALIALLVGCAFLLCALVLRQRNRRSAAYIAALEHLNEVALGIAAAPGEINPLLDRLAASARELLGMSISRISLLADDGHSIQRVHHFEIARREDDDLAIFQSPRFADDFLRGARGVFISDVRAKTVASEKIQLNDETLRRQEIGALILLPLIASRKTVGLMTLAATRGSRKRARREFTRAECRLAELLAAHAAATITSARLYRQTKDALEAHRSLVAQRDSLYVAATSMQKVKSSKEAVARAAELAPSGLDVLACVVCLVEEPPPDPRAVDVTFMEDTMRIAAVTPLPFPFPLREGMLLKCELFARLIRGGGEPIGIEDTDRDPLVAGTGLNSKHGVGSLLCVPLMFRSGKPTGALLLVRQFPRMITRESMKLAEMYSSRAAIAIDNARLQEQARRDTETKASLLRELNHRVKNNLAALVGLLNWGTPELSTEAQHWLERVIERIAAIGRAHDLFSTGGAVRLSRIIDTTLESIAALIPESVRVEIDMNDNDITLTERQTIPAALSIYELAYNAIVHGVGEDGRLEVRVRRPAPAHIAIDVIDSPGERAEPVPAGASAAVSSPPRRTFVAHQSSGIGLTLVRGLVSRELRGQFDIQTNEDGGATATIIFPVEAVNAKALP